MIHDNHTFLAFGLVAAFVLGVAGLCVGGYALFRISQITDQVERADDAATPSFTEPEPYRGPSKWREVGGHRFRVRTEEQPVAGDPAPPEEAPPLQDVPDGGPDGGAGGEAGREPTGATVLQPPQRPEA